MVFDITHLKKIRKRLDLTQHQFAKKSGISQSMVAKIESGKLDPTYSYVKKIENSIDLLTQNEEGEAKDIMINKVVSVKKEDDLSKIINLMIKQNISQVPVIQKEKVIGLVSESDLFGLTEEEINTKKALDIMKESPPIVAKNTKSSVIISLLKFYPIILVTESGKINGVITKADLIKRLKFTN